MAELARRFDLPASSIQPHRLKPNELLLVVSSEDEAIRIHNDGRPIQLGQLTLHCRRWSRFRNATGVSLPQLVDVEICGIPAHVWELDTAEHLLDEWCWVRALHPDTIHRRDYSTFRLSTWCSNPAMIPAAMDLVVVEPPVPVEEAPPLKRGLSYEVHIAVRPDEVQTLDVGAPPAPPPTGHDGRRRRRRRSRSPDSSPRSSADGSPARALHFDLWSMWVQWMGAAAQEPRRLLLASPAWGPRRLWRRLFLPQALRPFPRHPLMIWLPA